MIWPLSDDQGMSITEVTVVSALVVMVMAIVMGLFSGFFNNVQFQYSLEAAERETRPVIRELIIQTRQSIARSNQIDIYPVASIDWDELSFYSDRLPYNDGGAPELHKYELVNCSGGNNGGTCDLRLSITPPDDPSGPPWTYTGAPTTVRIELENVLADPSSVNVYGPLFEGTLWAGDPLAQVIVASCAEGTAAPCNFALVGIHLKVDPSLIRDNPRIFEIEESVRLRNA